MSDIKFNITLKTNTCILKLTYHNSKNEYPNFVADFTYNEKRILAIK
jgi:hypothetical protein